MSLFFKIFDSYVNDRYIYESDSIDCQRDPENEQQLTGENNVNFIFTVQRIFRASSQRFYF